MVQAWSMGSSKRGQSAISSFSGDTPGPGAYDQKSTAKEAPPKWSMKGKGSDSFGQKKDAPGPGSYNIPTTLTEGPKYHMAPRGISTGDGRGLNPGPGQYNPSLGKSSPNYSMSARLHSAQLPQSTLPGPGAYTTPNQYERIPGAKMGKDKRDAQPFLKTMGALPGPGTYSLPSSTAQNQAPKYGFGSDTRERGNNSRGFNPGPGAYNIQTAVGSDAKKVSLTARRPDTAPGVGKESPGPGAYEPKNNRKAPSYGVGTSQRSNNHASQASMPGPGAYAALAGETQKSAPSWKMGTSARGNFTSSNANPGPGNYQIPTKIAEGPKYGMTGKGPDARLDGIPGPGSYNPTTVSVKPASPNYGLGTASKGYKDSTSRKEVPGPGNYAATQTLGGPKYGFGSSLRPEIKKSDAPGPGNYKIPCSFGDVPKYAMTTQSAYKYI